MNKLKNFLEKNKSSVLLADFEIVDLATDLRQLMGAANATYYNEGCNNKNCNKSRNGGCVNKSCTGSNNVGCVNEI